MPETVVLVDDDADVRATLAACLREEGLDVLEAANGLEALLHVKRARPRAVVLDLQMPRLGGLEALKRIRAFDPEIRVVVVTSTEDAELHRQALALGARAVFTKPVLTGDVLAALGHGARPPATAAAGKILVVDDEPEIRRLLGEALGAMGYETRETADAPGGLRAVIDWAPDIVLLDIKMPGLDGVGALPAMAALAPAMKVIMVSGSTNAEVARRALAHGAFDYVTKPVDFEYLGHAIASALTMRELDETPGKESRDASEGRASQAKRPSPSPARHEHAPR